MLDFRSSTPYRRRRSLRPPFPHILCVVDGAGSEAAIVQAIAVADGDARVTFAGSWYGKGSVERAAASERKARQAVTSAVHRGREAGLQAGRTLFHTPRLSDVLVRAGQPYDLIVVGAHAHARMTGILLDETATRLVHRAPVPVLIAREAPLGAGVVAGTRAVADDRFAMTAAAHLAGRLGSELTVVHVAGRSEEQRRPELHAELANARALLGRELDFVREHGQAADALVRTAEGDGAGLIVVGSRGRLGVPALVSTSERVAHLAACSVLVMRGT